MSEFDSTTTRRCAVLVHFSAMIHEAAAPDAALQTIADTLQVATLAIGRIPPDTGPSHIMVQSKDSIDVRATWILAERDPKECLVALTAGPLRDVLVVQTRLDPIPDRLRGDLAALSPFLASFWAARSPRFETALNSMRVELDESILHPDNPYELTPAQLRICALIASGSRPQDMAESLGLSITTIRTHLSQIYAKTGLDGMVSVIHHLQLHSQIRSRAS